MASDRSDGDRDSNISEEVSYLSCIYPINLYFSISISIPYLSIHLFVTIELLRNFYNSHLISIRLYRMYISFYL